MKRRVLVFVWSMAVALAQPVANRIVLETSTILDGQGGVLKGQQIVIEGSRIQSVKPGRRKPHTTCAG